MGAQDRATFDRAVGLTVGWGFALAVVADAGLSYVGLGTQPPTPSWGKMLNDAQTFIYQDPLLALYPGLAITLSVLGLNLLGDGLRDALDPSSASGGQA